MSSKLHLLRQVAWKSRTGCLTFSASGFSPLYILGVHGQMHNEAGATLTEVASLLPADVDRSQVAMVGDWNIDHSYSLQDVPWAADEPASLTQARSLLQNFASQRGAEIVFPGYPWFGPGVLG